MQLNRDRFLRLLVGGALIAVAAPAQAYMPPGVGLGVIATSLSILGAVLLGLMAILWYPLKRIVRKVTGRKSR